MDINYRNIRNASSHLWYERALSEHLTMTLSPLISILFIKHNVKPNSITILMIISGIIAPIMFMVENIWVKVLASILFLLWFTFDASDGEVARFTSTFSKHGRDLDYLSHVSCHSLFIMSMWKIYAYSSEYLLQLSIFFFLLLSIELFYRMTVIYSVYVEKTEVVFNSSQKLKTNIILNLIYFPNFVVFFPSLYCISHFAGFDLLPFYFATFSIYMLVNIKDYIAMIKRFYKA